MLEKKFPQKWFFALFLNQDNEVSAEEFKKGIEVSCKGKGFADLPNAFRFFIDAQFRTIDVDGEKNQLEY